MTRTVSTTADTLRLHSGAQSMFDTGPAQQVVFSDYVPIIGGEARDLGLDFVRASAGRATIDGDRIVWDDRGAFDGLAPGAVDRVFLRWDVVDPDGTRIDSRAEIEVRGTAAGPVFTNLDTGEVTTDGMSLVGFTAADMLQDVHRFDTVRLVDIDLDLDELLDVDLAAALGDLGDMGELAALGAKVLGLQAGAGAARGLADGAASAFRFLNEAKIEENAAIGARAIAQTAFDAAGFALDTAEATATFATNAAAGFLEGLDDFGDVLEDIGTAVVNFFTGRPSLEDVRDTLLAQSANADIQATIARVNFDFGIGSEADLLAKTQAAAVSKSLLAGIDAAIAAENGDTSALDALARDVRALDLDLTEARAALDRAEARVTDAIADVAARTEAFRQAVQGKTLEGLDSLADRAEGALEAAKAEALDKLDALQARGLLEDVDSGARDVFSTLANIAFGTVKAVDDALFGIADEVDVSAKLQLDVDAFAQAGLIVDFRLDGGTVTSDMDFDLTSTATYDDAADTFTIQALAQNVTSGEAVAFETVSPSLEFFAGIAYHAGATFDYLIDLFAAVADFELVDLGPLSFSDSVEFDGVLGLIDFDSKDFDGIELTLPGFLGDIVSAEVNVPTVETEGRRAEFSAEAYRDPATGFDLDKLASVILDLVNLRLEFSPEMQAVLAREGISTDIGAGGLGEAISAALQGVLATLDGSGDTDGDGFVPVFQVTTGEKGADGLIHLDTITPDLSGVDLQNGGRFGFFVSEGASDNLFQVNLDVDQLIATVVNVALGNTPQSTINPLDLTIGIGEILDIAAAPQSVIDTVESFLKADLSVQVADLDVRAGANFNQSFALSVDDVDFDVVFEDGTTRRASASEGGAIVIENASSTLRDIDGDGEIAYSLQLTPDATLFNDTELGLNVGYTLDFLKSQLQLAAALPLDTLFPGLGIEALPALEQTLSLGPILRLEGDLDLVTADVFESLFDFDAGSAAIESAFAFAPAAGGGTGGEDGGTDVLIGDPVAPGDIIVDVAPEPLPVFPEPEAPVLADGPILGTRRADSLLGTGEDDRIRAKGGDDLVQAGGGKDRVAGGNGADVLFGEDGRDRLKGGGGADAISGGAGADKIVGGAGDDILQGDAGADTFQFARGHGSDNIVDFEVGIDTIAIGRGANGIGGLDIAQDGASAVIAFADVEIRLDAVSVDALLEADSFLF